MRLSAAIAAIACISLGGCISGGAEYPQATAGYVAKPAYNADFNKSWNAVLAALNANQIAVASSSREAGQITTDYRAGSETLVGLGLVGANTSRYKFTVFVTRSGAKTTSIRVSMPR